MSREPRHSLFALRWPEFEFLKTWVGLEIEPAELLRMPPRRGNAAKR